MDGWGKKRKIKGDENSRLKNAQNKSVTSVAGDGRSTSVDWGQTRQELRQLGRSKGGLVDKESDVVSVVIVVLSSQSSVRQVRWGDELSGEEEKREQKGRTGNVKRKATVIEQATRNGLKKTVKKTKRKFQLVAKEESSGDVARFKGRSVWRSPAVPTNDIAPIDGASPLGDRGKQGNMPRGARHACAFPTACLIHHPQSNAVTHRCPVSSLREELALSPAKQNRRTASLREHTLRATGIPNRRPWRA